MEEIKNEIKLDASNQVKIISEISDEVFKELETNSKNDKKYLKQAYAERSSLFYKVMEKMLGKLLFKLKIKIVVYWDDKELFSYVIPKN